MTRGCISMENDDMDEVFNKVDVGTPVTIVGSMTYTHEILSIISEFLNVQK